MLSFTALCVAIVTLVVVDGFLVVPGIQVVVHSATRLSTAHALSSDQDWVSLADGVKKRVIEKGEGNVAQEKSAVKVEYTGTLVGEQDWTVQDVVDCWLDKQQGLDHLKDAFMERQIDGSKLMDSNFFTEEFVTNELQLSNKIQCKKLVMASKRLAKQQKEFLVGTEFDSSKERGPFKFTLGEGKVIRACELAVATMKQGERALVLCRADYAYGSEGFRKQNGHVVVPPFSSLCFDMTLLTC
jgi:FK506-binding protein 4/5